MNRHIALVSAVLLTCWQFALPAHAIDVLVTTDKPTYAPGEPVQINVTAQNPDTEDVTLNFSSSAQATYILDDTWDWSHHRAFLTVLTSRTIPARGQYTWSFTHNPNEFFLGPGLHEIEGRLINQKLDGGFETIEVSSPAPFAVVPDPTALSPLLAPLVLLLRRQKMKLQVHTDAHRSEESHLRASACICSSN
jgi:hypothetical protein